ncbi:hypothetical protein BDD12DRAFT_901079 [Trichophaea hybrida]|nr:hypothetical protein BDD12DRAFT_901079 [Trichophaea hybrida]
MAMVASISTRCIRDLPVLPSLQNRFASEIQINGTLYTRPHPHPHPHAKLLAPIVVAARSYSTALIESSQQPPPRRLLGPADLKPPLSTYANFGRIRLENFSYFDKTGYIPSLCKPGDATLICRPRQFGKSLTVSMLQHFHGFQYKGKYEELFGGLAVDKASLESVNKLLLRVINRTIQRFIHNHPWMEWDFNRADLRDPELAAFNFEDFLCMIDSNIAKANKTSGGCEQLKGVEGILVTIDEYDASSLATIMDDEKLLWKKTSLSRTYEAFFKVIKSAMSYDYGVRMVYMTGILPVLLAQYLSSSNMIFNKSFDPDFADLFGLTTSDASEALDRLYGGDEKTKKHHLGQLIYYANGYCFTPSPNNGLESIFNPETSLQYLNALQKGLNKGRFDIADPPHSEINDVVMDTCTTSYDVVADMTQALMRDNDGKFCKLPYDNLPGIFNAATLAGSDHESRVAWRSLMVHIGGLTFDPDSPGKHLKIPNNVAVARIAQAICDRYHLKQDNVLHALKALVSNDGKIKPILDAYGTIMTQTATHAKHFTADEAFHRDRMCGVLLQNHGIKTNLEYNVQKRSHPDNTETGYIDICLDTKTHRLIVELKCVQLQYLSMKTRNVLGRAEKLAKMSVKEVLALKFGGNDKYRKGITIKDWIDKEVRDQLYAYGLSPEMNSDAHGKIFRAYSVQNGPGRAGPNILRPGPKALYKARPAALSAGFSGLSLAGL